VPVRARRPGEILDIGKRVIPNANGSFQAIAAVHLQVLARRTALSRDGWAGCPQLANGIFPHAHFRRSQAPVFLSLTRAFSPDCGRSAYCLC
jgi:hypothetical protein